MNAQILTFSANEQTLIKTGGIDDFASNTVRYAKATFTLGTNWTGFDSVRAVWKTACYTISTVLDANHSCDVPPEVLSYKAKVYVNLVGSISENGVLTDRLTTFPVLAMHIKSNAPVEGTETAPVTASQFEQFVETVQNAAESISDYSYDSEAWAVGKRGGVDVPSTDETYHNNSKYWAEQNAGLSDEVADLKEDLSNITQVHYGKNRLDIHAPFTDGYLDASGTFVQDERWKTCDYCYVEGADELTFSYESGGARYNGTFLYICTYTADKTFIERLSTQTVSPIQIGQNVAYVRWSFNYTPSDSAKLMLEKGGTITTYEPFNDYLYIKTDDTLTEPNMPADSYAVGERLKHIQDVLDYSQATLTMTGERLLNAHTGAITVSAGKTGWKVSDYVEIQSSSRVIVKTQHFWGQGLYAFYDENKSYISGLASEPGGTVTRLYDVVVETPSNAKYIIIGFLGGDRMEVPALFIGTKQNALPSQRWSGKKWACIGDSLTESYGVTEIHYFEYIRALTGIETVNLGSSGNGYATNGGNFMIKAQQVPSDTDLVTIFGSGNDASSGLPLGDASDTGTSTIAGCINTAIDNVFNVNPIVPLGIVTPTPWVNDMPYDDGWMEQYSELIVNICRLRSIPCLDLFHCSNLNPNSAAVRSTAYSKDNGGGVHPNEAGHRIIATHFKGFLDSLII